MISLEVELLAIPKKRAEEEFEAIKQALRTNKKLQEQQIYREFQKVYGHLQYGKKIIDVYEAFKKVGLNEDGDPKLAIVRADSKVVLCEERNDGSVTFWHDRGLPSLPRNPLWRWSGDHDDIKLPANTFKWKIVDGRQQYGLKQTITPIIPAKILVNEIKVLLRNFHIIWEVEKWKPIPPRDPILVKRLTPNLFGVLATWNLTELERAIIRGRIQ